MKNQFVSDGITYEVISEKEATVKIIAVDQNAHQPSEELPQSINFNDKFYQVINNDGFVIYSPKQDESKNSFGSCKSYIDYRKKQAEDTADGTITFPKDSKKVTSLYPMFRRRVKHIRFEEGFETIGHHAFSYFKTLQTVTMPKSIRRIEREAFADSSVRKVELSEGLISLEYGAFRDCNRLEAVTIPGGVESIGVSAFMGCHNLKTVEILPGVTAIEDKAFLDCYELETVIIPDSVKKIGADAFSNCQNLKAVILPKDIEVIKEGTFNQCFELKSINIPENVKAIGAKAFRECKSLESIKIPESVTEIGDGAFCFCEQLTSIKLPDNLKSVNYALFSSCTRLAKIEFPQNMEMLYSVSLYDTEFLKSQPDGIVYINNWAYGYKGTMQPDTELEIKEGTIGISAYAFQDRKNLKSVKIPKSVKFIGEKAFDRIIPLEPVEIQNI